MSEEIGNRRKDLFPEKLFVSTSFDVDEDRQVYDARPEIHPMMVSEEGPEVIAVYKLEKRIVVKLKPEIVGDFKPTE